MLMCNCILARPGAMPSLQLYSQFHWDNTILCIALWFLFRS